MFMNLFVFKAINGAAHMNGTLDEMMILFSNYSPLLFVAAIAALYLYGVYRKDKMFRYAAIDAFAVTVMSLFLGFVIGIFYYEPRPFVTDHVNLLTPHAPDASFPSDHSLGTMSIALGINNTYRVFGTIMIILSLLVGVSRVYVGVHYPMDVLGSYLIVMGVNFIYRHLLREKIRTLYSKIEEYLLNRISRIKHEEC
ncbi:undecaprenyl-diphosphatase [Desulfitobacterium metallireducens]|nr:undecaprenyl-diphosphatase [Desulfitobacterium metallireducens]